MQELKFESSAINSLSVDPSAGTAQAEYKDGRKYLYTNVNVDSIYDLLKNGTESFGRWVNINLAGKRGVSYTQLQPGSQA
jgi:hypothetical protein